MESEEILNEEQLLKKHRQERKDLQAKIQSLKKAAPKGDKRKKKEIADTIAQLEKDLDDKQSKELNMVGRTCISNEESEQSNDNMEELNEEQSEVITKVTRAQRRRNKKHEEDKEREKRILEQEEANKQGPRILESTAIKDILKSNNMEIFNIPADGNCLYCAVNHQLEITGRETSTVSKLRKVTAEFMRQHKEDFLPFMYNDSEEPVDDKQFESYCKDVATTKLWGGQLELKALSNVLKCPIKVIQASGPQTVQGENFQGPPLVLTYHRHLYRLGEHYNSTIQNEVNDTQS
ncbi:hypothetical protein Trydic_g22439 [Trypoxylus dichotomus]